MSQSLRLEEVLEDLKESDKLYSLVLISIINPSSEIRLAAVNKLHQLYTPQIRRAYVDNQDVFIEAYNNGEFTPYLIAN